MWEVEATDAFEDWWRTLTEQEQDDVTATVELLAERGPKLPFPYSSGIEGSKYSHMRELRIQSHGDPIRVFYAFDPRRVAVLLHVITNPAAVFIKAATCERSGSARRSGVSPTPPRGAEWASGV